MTCYFSAIKDARNDALPSTSQAPIYNHRSDFKLVNVALNKPAHQSSTGGGGRPQRAVDGNVNGNYEQYVSMS